MIKYDAVLNDVNKLQQFAAYFIVIFIYTVIIYYHVLVIRTVVIQNNDSYAYEMKRLNLNSFSR